MPFGHGRTGGNAAKLSNRGGFSPSKRPLEQNDPTLGLKEQLGPVPILWNTDQRCIILTFATLELDTWKFVEPFSLLVQESHLKNPVDSEGQVNKDGLESLYPPLSIILPVDLPKEQNLDSSKDSKQPVFAKLHNSSGADILGQSRDRSTPIESMNSSKASLAKPLVSNNSSVPECDGSSLLDTDFLVSNTPKVDKAGKRSSKKKRKKKGKQNKKSTWKPPPGEGVHCQESSSNASVSEIVISSDPTSTCEYNLQCNITEKLTDHGLPAHDTAMEDKKEVNNSDHIHSSSPPLTRAPFGSERCEPIFSSCQMSSDEEVSTNQTDTDAGSIFLSANSSSSPAPEVIQLSSDESTTNTYASGISCSTSCDEYNAPVVTSYVDNWKIGVSRNCTNGLETMASFKDNQGHNLSDGTIILDTRGSGTSCHSISEVSCDKNSEISANCYNYWSKDVVDAGNNTEITHCSSQSPSSSGFQIVVNRKRDRLIKKLSQGLNGTGRFDMVHDQTGKESNHSTCQRGQKNGSERICEAKKKPNTISLYAKGSEVQERFDPLFGLKQNVSGNFQANTSELVSPISRIKASSKGVNEIKIPSRTIDLKQSDRSKNKPASSSNQGNHHPKKVSQTEKTSYRPPMIHVQQNGDISPQQTHQKLVGARVNSYSNDFQSVVVTPSIKVDYCPSEPHQNAAENQTSTSLLGSNSLEEKQVKGQSNSGKEMAEDSFLTDREDCRNATNSESNISHTDHSKLDNSCIPVLWDPLSGKDSLTSSTDQTDTLTDTTVNDSVIYSLNPKNPVESLGSNSHCSLQMNDGISCLSPCLRETTAPSLEADELKTHHPQTCGDKGYMLPISSSGLSHEVKIKYTSNVETDLDMIVKAVNDSYKSWTASESVRIATGSPIAEFERFLHSASPVLDKRYCSGSSGSLTSDQLSSETLCQCQIPNIPLKCFWEWYERPSCYGMEVIVQDYLNSRRSHNGQFSAYFVPYLSAIQLFGWSRSSVRENSFFPSEVMVETCEVAARDEFHNKSFRSTQFVDGEVLFEYFESERPQLRRPLFEKIKELVGSGASSDGKVYGDRLKLECVNLHELHPASWFSVAWYPIYRIPDGRFRAAFITYHSLGHFVHTTHNTSDGVDHIISPVVGLQSYNAKGECWFLPRDSKSNVFQQEATMSLDPSQILKERLSMLEKTASVMARASVCKGNVRSVNKQPDYEFFLSRTR